jgi:S-formylglutathione hydrolase FrmB
MMLATHYPQLFASASSLLGTLDIAQMFPDHYRLRQLLGPERGTWDSFSPTRQVERLFNTRLRLSTAERASDRGQNEAFARALEAHHISFEYGVYAGEHNTAFVRQHIGEMLAFHQRVFDDGCTCG